MTCNCPGGFGAQAPVGRAAVTEQRGPTCRDRGARQALENAAGLTAEQDVQYDSIRDQP